MKNKVLKTLLFIFIGGLGGFIFPPFNNNVLISFVLASVFLSFMLWTIFSAKNKKQAFIFPFILSFLSNVVAFDWLRQPFYFVGMGNFSFLVVLLFDIFWALFFGLIGLLVFHVKKDKRYFAFAFFIMFFEWVKSWIFTGFPWNPISLIWSSYLPVIQIVSIIGSLGLSFLSVFVLCLPLFIILNKDFYKKKMFYFIIFIIIFVLGFGYFRIFKYQNIEKIDKKVRIVNLGISIDGKYDEQVLDDYINISNMEGSNNIDLFVWSETSVPYDLFRDDFALMKLMNFNNNNNSYLITGFNRIQPLNNNDFKLFNTMVLMDKSGILDFYDKRHLVPFGEYMPLKSVLPFEKFTKGFVDFSMGEEEIIFNFDDMFIYPLICYEAIFSNLNLPKHVDLIVNISNDKWFGIIGKYQHLNIVKFRAVEEGVPLLRVANDGISALISPIGDFIEGKAILKNGVKNASFLNDFGVMDIDLVKRFERTLFSLFGNYLIVFTIILGFLYLYFNFLNKIIDKNK